MINRASYARNMAGRTNHTILMTVASLILMVLLSKGMGAQEVHKGMDKHTDKRHSKEREHKGANFAQIICKEVKKAFHKHSNKHKKRHMNDSVSDSNSCYSL